jgi:hypothetical protein
MLVRDRVAFADQVTDGPEYIGSGKVGEFLFQRVHIASCVRIDSAAIRKSQFVLLAGCCRLDDERFCACILIPWPRRYRSSQIDGQCGRKSNQLNDVNVMFNKCDFDIRGTTHQLARH